jgi:5-methylcytosine-specific restriction endonuclease McrA
MTEPRYCDVCSLEAEEAVIACRDQGADPRCLAFSIWIEQHGQAVEEEEQELARQADPKLEPIRLLLARPHQFGAGRVHAFLGGKTRCGKRPEDCPGAFDDGDWYAVTCGGCLKGYDADRRRAAEAERSRELQAQAEQQQRDWWAWYTAYLNSPQWAGRRRLVLERARGLCEGCRKRRATQVHHLTYRMAGEEMLFQLVAVCDDCHDLITARSRERRRAPFAIGEDPW